MGPELEPLNLRFHQLVSSPDDANPASLVFPLGAAFGMVCGAFNRSPALNNDDDVLTLISSHRPTSEASTVSVSDFGAKGDGKTDDTQAFKKAWMKACSTNGVTGFLVS
ncbi:hypothetical protein YC2023_052274 [Brassica napus]